MIVWVKYGFEATPLKMYNTNVSCAILLSFLKATCIKDIDEYCKQKNIQLSIELDALRRSMQHRKSNVAATTCPTDTPPGSRPPSGSATPATAAATTVPSLTGSGGSLQPPPSTPNTTRRGSNASSALHTNDQADEAAATAKLKKEQLEKQLETVNTAAKLIKELIAGVSWVDLVDQNGTRMNLDTAGALRVNTVLTERQQYTAVVVTTTESGAPKTVPLVFKLSS